MGLCLQAAHLWLLMTASTTTDTKGRSGMRVFSSDDLGESWQLHLTLTPNNWSTGYSSMARIGETEDVACLFEVSPLRNPPNYNLICGLFSDTACDYCTEPGLPEC